MNVHPNSKLGKARTAVATLRGQVEPKKQHLYELKRERAAKQTLVDGATLDTPPFEVLAAESRIRLLDRAITNETAQLAPLEAQLQRAEAELRNLEQEAEARVQGLPELQDTLHPDVQMWQLGRWMSELAETRNAVQELTEAPLAPGARWVPVVTVAFQLLAPGEQLPERGPSPREQRRLAQLEVDRLQEQVMRARVLGSDRAGPLPGVSVLNLPHAPNVKVVDSVSTSLKEQS